MTPSPTDAPQGTASARLNMVEGQIRPNRVTDPRLVEALLALPRERFLPPERRVLAYAETDVPLTPPDHAGGVRCLLSPMVHARLIQEGQPQPGDRVLEVGSGCGYGLALLARLVAHVTGLESDRSLPPLGAAELSGLANVTQVAGPLAAGWPDGAPYDMIIIPGAVAELPLTLTAQLADGGRLVTVERRAGGVGRAVLARKVAGTVGVRPLFDAAAPWLPDFAPRPAFSF